jgi:transcriptional regulator with XRE-family HTH domain
MTTGQFIAQKRKERQLSQEALGELLGVSRQSIYKWESDAALPEIDKLVALSRLFGVTVGTLLGVEEPAPDDGQPEGTEGELTEAQLKMVEEIVDRYLAAQPKPAPALSPRRRKVVKLCVTVGVICLAVVLYRLSSQLGQLDNRYSNLQNTVGNISSSVNGQIGSITNRVEEILKAQNSLTADYGTELTMTSPDSDTAVFSVYAVPKTYEEGMTVEFLADNGQGGVNKVSGEEGANQRFSATVASSLTDSITISAVFVSPDGTRQTQLLEQYSGLYSDTLVPVDVMDHGSLIFREPEGSKLSLDEEYISVSVGQAMQPVGASTKPAELRSLRVGLFRNRQLIVWLEEQDAAPQGWEADPDERFFRLAPMTLTITEGDQLDFVAVYTDQYDRTAVSQAIPAYVLDRDPDTQTLEVSYGGDLSLSHDPSEWSFTFPAEKQ